MDTADISGIDRIKDFKKAFTLRLPYSLQVIIQYKWE